MMSSRSIDSRLRCILRVFLGMPNSSMGWLREGCPAGERRWAGAVEEETVEDCGTAGGGPPFGGYAPEVEIERAREFPLAGCIVGFFRLVALGDVKADWTGALREASLSLKECWDSLWRMLVDRCTGGGAGGAAVALTLGGVAPMSAVRCVAALPLPLPVVIVLRTRWD